MRSPATNHRLNCSLIMPTTILLVDDDDDFRRVAAITLKRAGYEVHEARNGAQAVHECFSLHPNLVIIDLIMPEQEGLETIVELRQMNPALPIIAISGGGRNTPEDYLAMAKKLGANRMLAKPFMGSEMLQVVSEVLAA